MLFAQKTSINIAARSIMKIVKDEFKKLNLEFW